MNVVFFVLGFMDIIGGLLLFTCSGSMVEQIVKFIALVLVGKGIWTIVTSLSS